MLINNQIERLEKIINWVVNVLYLFLFFKKERERERERREH
jgi:Ca2+/Na+ antiporter